MHCLREPFKSAYTSSHSTWMALLRVQPDIVSTLDSGHVAVLDLSDAFDTLDHQFLLGYLQDAFGVTRSARFWTDQFP